MKKYLIFITISLVIFIFGYRGITYLFQNVKHELITNNNTILMNLIANHPELEGEIIHTLKNLKPSDDVSVLEKYGLTSLSSLEYLTNIFALHQTFILTYVLFFLFVFTLIFLFYFWQERKRKKEFQKIDQYLFSLLSNDIKVDLKDFQSGELAKLQNDLMKVTSRLKNALETSTKDKDELSKNMADISHQLKTPLTSLLIINDNLSTFNLDEKTRQSFLKKQEQIILHMKTLIIEILKVSQIESGTILLKKDKLNVKKTIDFSLEQVDIFLASKNINVTCNIPSNIFIIGDQNWLGEAIANILKNACEHSKENGLIEIKASENPVYVELTIKDYGEGIAAKDLKNIFKRFYKSNHNSDSIGIGLNLTKMILDRSNATIECQSKQNNYTIFQIHFYKGIV